MALLQKLPSGTCIFKSIIYLKNIVCHCFLKIRTILTSVNFPELKNYCSDCLKSFQFPLEVDFRKSKKKGGWKVYYIWNFGESFSFGWCGFMWLKKQQPTLGSHMSHTDINSHIIGVWESSLKQSAAGMLYISLG